jgi:hypothetical protein
MIIALIPPIQRFIWGRRDSRQLSEAAADLSLAFGSLWLFIIFPFDFAHLADPLPTNMRFAFAWITNNVARIILLLQVIIGFLSALGIMIGGRKLRVPRAAEHTNRG